MKISRYGVITFFFMVVGLTSLRHFRKHKKTGAPKNFTPKEFLGLNLPQKFKVTGLTQNHETWAGYLPVRPGGSTLFYNLFSKRQGSLTDEAPLILWLNGGPGCASMYGNFEEIGPIRVRKVVDDKQEKFIIYNADVTWADTNHVLFVDSPIGTGLSVAVEGEKVSSTAEAMDDLYTFLGLFFGLFPELKKNPFYIFGESYAGHYIPQIAKLIYNNLETNGINFKGIGIGDGWIDPPNQVIFYDMYGYAAGLISNKLRSQISVTQQRCYLDVLEAKLTEAANLADDAVDMVTTESKNINTYNVRQYNVPDLATSSYWLNETTVRQMFFIPDGYYYFECSDNVFDDFVLDEMVSFRTVIESLIGKIKILIYTGQDDGNVISASHYLWISKMQFPGGKKFSSAQKQIWKMGDQVVGNMKTMNDFTLVWVYNSGHMVPTDQPRPARQMLENYLNDKKWNE